MSSLHIRSVDPLVLSKLKRMARLHHRSLQGELRAILEEAAARAPSDDAQEPLRLVTVQTGNTDSWSRETIYGDEGR